MNKSRMDLLVNALLEGDQAGAVSEAKKLREQGVGVDNMVTEGIEVAMTQLDDKCTIG